MNAVGRLDRLGAALAAAGWSVRLRYRPPILHVYSQDAPHAGESVTVRTGPDGRAWFWSSTGRGLAPCSDIRGARAGVAALLGAVVPAPRRRRLSVRSVILGR
ncbi:hypothetical protein [Actinomadura sp. 7K534]|uniref:hypothetical protein n=1 Tax=Actinomadura sp. 7K534 TaxID=2530366 RepID=UPI0010487111|nr:hypothetical protein [Actinomadura sp. 7K534]TDB85337.1 hypothetical protein E1266_35685 [Actinomadura sp. 7K534]